MTSKEARPIGAEEPFGFGPSPRGTPMILSFDQFLAPPWGAGSRALTPRAASRSARSAHEPRLEQITRRTQNSRRNPSSCCLGFVIRGPFSIRGETGRCRDMFGSDMKDEQI